MQARHTPSPAPTESASTGHTRSVGQTLSEAVRELLRRRTLWVLAGLASAALVLHAQSFMPFMSDDSFISLRYSERLLQGQGLTWNDGERVEGYSNLLWVLMVAAIGALGVDLVLAARVLGLVSSSVALTAIVYYARPAALSSRASLVGAVAALAVALTGSVAVWSIGGLEAPLVAGLLSLGYVLALGKLKGTEPLPARTELWWPAAVPLGVVCWARPDAVLFVTALAVVLVLVPGPSRSRLVPPLTLLGVAASCVVLQLAFRLAYYGEWVPNTARVKLAWTPERLREGWVYLSAGLEAHWPLLVLSATALLPLFEKSMARYRVMALLAGAVGWSMYVLAIGGDIFPAWRHLVPLVVLLALLSVEGLGWFAMRSGRVWWTTFGASSVLVGALFVVQSSNPRVEDARRERWEWDAVPIGALYQRHFAKVQPLLAVDSAGCLPYFSKLPALDMLGLNDPYLAKHPPAGMGTGELGHELGDGAYFLRRRPDIVMFGIPSDHGQPKFRGGREMFHSRLFQNQYSAVVFETENRTYRSWFNRASDKVGLGAKSAGIEVPGYFFSSERVPTTEDGQGRLVVALNGKAWQQQSLHLPRAGRWRVRAHASRSVRLALSMQGRSRRGQDRLSFTLPRAGKVSLRVRAAGAERSLLERVVFEPE